MWMILQVASIYSIHVFKWKADVNELKWKRYGPRQLYERSVFESQQGYLQTQCKQSKVSYQKDGEF